MSRGRMGSWDALIFTCAKYLSTGVRQRENSVFENQYLRHDFSRFHRIRMDDAWKDPMNKTLTREQREENEEIKLLDKNKQRC